MKRSGRRAAFAGIGVAMAATSAWAVASVVQDDRDLRTGPVPSVTTTSMVPGITSVAGPTSVATAAPSTSVTPPASSTAGTAGTGSTVPGGDPAPTSAPAPAPAPEASTTTTTRDPEENTGDRPVPGAFLPPSFFADEDTTADDEEALSQSGAADDEQHAREAQEVWGDEAPFDPGPADPFIPVGPEYGDELSGG